MLATSLLIGSFVTILFFIVGIMLGWVAREYMMNFGEVPKFHPEMYDQNGNIIPDEILAVRFENDYDYDEDEED
jgi:hypothetical protein